MVIRVAGVGSNSGFAAGQLKSLVERVERLEEEKEALGTDIKEVFGEAKAHGFDTKILRQLIRLRRIPASQRQENEAILELYMSAVAGVEKQETQKSYDEGEDGPADGA